jgi:3-isopropylmalate/(R)-2-methylmalate dehydratase large subunit
MGTIAEKIITDKLNRDVTPGEIIQLPVDLAFGHDVTLPPAITAFDRLDVDSVFDPDRVAVIPDHLVPAHSEYAAELYTACKEFAETHGTVFYPQGTQGQEHVVIPEDGLVKPGDVMVGADSHSCTEGAMGVYSLGVGSTDLAFAMAFGWIWARIPETIRINYVGDPGDWVSGKDLALTTVSELGVDGAVYKALELGGPAIRDLSMDDRFTLSNMAIEAGAATGIVEPDETTAAFADSHCDGEYTFYTPSPDATYSETVTIDCSGLEPQVAVPNLPENAQPVSSVQAAGIEIDQAVIGSCTNGRRSDLETAAEILDGETVADDVRLIITPGSQDLEQESIEEGWTATFLEANATLENPGCGACFGMRTGVLDEDEIAVSTTNRNFTGRMGAPSSDVYLASPAVAAASAVAGEIVHPTEVA